MGFLANTTNYALIAKLTPEGRRKIITGSNTTITQFSLGDSDAYYGVFEGLSGDEVPAVSGYNNGADRNNGGYRYQLRSTLSFNTSTDKKNVETASSNVVTTAELLGIKTINNNGVSMGFNIVDLSGTSTDRFTNLYYSFGLPITSNEFNTYTGLTTSQGGYSNTALSGLAQTKMLVIDIADKEYAEIIDGKSIKMVLPASGQTYNLYGTYQNKGGSLVNENAQIYDTAPNVSQFGPNIALLFSDEIVRPNGGNPAKSWATGYDQTNPFSLNNKELWNIQTNVNVALTADTPVGIAYLDKGFLVITDPTIIASYELNPAWSGLNQTKIYLNHARNKVSQSITCIAGNGEFSSSNNPTWGSSDVPRITEIALWDDVGTLMAIGKLNKTYAKPGPDFVAFNITIDY